MGQSQSGQLAIQQWIEKEWQYLPCQSQTYGRKSTLRNYRTGALVDEYLMVWDNYKDYQFYLRSFSWRKRRSNNSPIVTSIGIKLLSSGGICSYKWTALVYLEHVDIRLNQIEDIPLPDSIYILLTALQGYQQLVEEDQICIQKGGKVKVWVNLNLSKNYPEGDPQEMCLKRDETHMVRQVVDIIQSNTDPDELKPGLLSSYLANLRRKQRCDIGFQRAITAVLEFSQIYAIPVLNRMESAIQLYNQIHRSDLVNNSIRQPLQYPPIQRRETITPTLCPIRSMPHLHFAPSFSYYPPTSIPNHQQKVSAPSVVQSPEDLNVVDLARKKSVSPSNGTGVKESRPTTKSKSQMVYLQEVTANQSINLGEDDKTLRGGSQKQGSLNRHVRAKNCLRYSHNLEQNVSKGHNCCHKYNRDTFGLPGQRYDLKESTSSHRLPYSSSQKSSNAHYSMSYKASSRRQSAHGSSYSEIIVETSLEQKVYFNSQGEYDQLDPQIAADILRYLG